VTKHYLAIISIPLVLATLIGVSAPAQDLTMPSLSLPEEGDFGYLEEVPAGDSDQAEDAGPGDPRAAGAYDNFRGLDEANNDLWGYGPALTESTGTWLRRGWWYTELDAVVLNRQWKRDDMVLAVDNTQRPRCRPDPT